MRQGFLQPTPVRQALISALTAIVVLSSSAVFVFAEPLNPHDNAIMYAQQGASLMKLGQYGQAVEYFKGAIKLNPYSAMAAPTYNNLGLSYQGMGQYPLAIASFQHAIRIQPNYALYYKNLINVYAVSGQLQAAEIALNQIVKDNPDDAEAHYLLGLTYQAMGQGESSTESFKRFVALKPNTSLALSLKKHL